MASTGVRSRITGTIRLVARVWSALLLGVALLMVFLPEQGLLETSQAGDWLLLGAFPGLTLLGLAVAWRWETTGGLIAIASLVARLLVYAALHSQLPSLSATFLQALVFVTPGLLFMWAASLARREQSA